MKKLIRTIAVAGFASLAFFQLHAGPLFDVQNGTWVVTSELNGQPGRGMALDVQDGMLVMQVYNYERSGQPTFHLASGLIAEGRFTGPLVKYKGGRYFGSGPLDGVQESVAGNVDVNFTTATSGTVQFPGEPPVHISRFRFDQIASGQLTAQGRTELWYVAELDKSDSNKPINAWLLGLSSYNGANTITIASPFKGSSGFYPCATHSIYPDTLTCSIALANTMSGTNELAPHYVKDATQVTVEINKKLEGMTGNIKYQIALVTGEKRTQSNRLVGMRMMTSHNNRTQQDVWSPRSFWKDPYFYAPDPGTWIVSSELNGKPGRGMAIDVQGDTFMMQVYNYEPSGASTFHLGVSSFDQGQATAHLKRYEGGRYFGSPPLIGAEVADAGKATLSFDSPTTGLVQFPGETPVAIQRFGFGMDYQRPASLLGQWVFWDRKLNKITAIELTSVDGVAAVGTVLGTTKPVKCLFEKTPQGTVRCADPIAFSPSPTLYYTFDYRFAPVNGRAQGGAMDIVNKQPVESAYGDLFVLHAKDRRGTLGGSVINQLFMND